MSKSKTQMVRLVVSNHTPEELALGYLRYEAVRRMSPRTFGELYKLNLSGSFFDDLVDEALKNMKNSNKPSIEKRVGRKRAIHLANAHTHALQAIGSFIYPGNAKSAMAIWNLATKEFRAATTI